ncbi:6-hydroxymethylpterin diphosphokinase MptE-like protein [Haladaptatus sp. YSMS36]|uniref:6-hydroxymethylpterin diphosphokinase MptE-like protein n=1 Tax=Haladaptatus sp. YSMS36 TaxID=3033384 RepID=UPI0023E8DADD|nr:6-hydroxymethylpterin diphosphokinase MptE-like protein [Haladaptatus sp. YSMS36]
MDYSTWSPVYHAILGDFGFPEAADVTARDELAARTDPFDLDRLGFLAGATVAIAGAAPSLAGELDIAREADAVVAASTAADVLREAGIAVDLMVTDIDKNPETIRTLTREGTPVAVHAHGDNIPAIRAEVPTFVREHVLPTTQAAPVAPVENFGGFTDGDRAAFLADHFGAGALTFLGWDFDDPAVDPMKAKKLDWAERLLYWLERRRGEQFTILDGRREAIDTSDIPR